MKPFNLEKAKAGKPVCLKNGEKIRIICWNAKGEFPIIGLRRIGDIDMIISFSIEGHSLLGKYSNVDLMMADDIDSLPTTWEEWVEQNPHISNESYVGEDSAIADIKEGVFYRNPINNANLLPSEEHAEAILALIQLIRLRDCYRQGWKPDWKSPITKYIITIYKNELIVTDRQFTDSIFSFPSPKVRDKFLNNFKDLLEQVKILWS